ncbi:MAG: M13-type metalloendopeptidase [Candidatus Acidiferrales bacterium]
MSHTPPNLKWRRTVQSHAGMHFAPTALCEKCEMAVRRQVLTDEHAPAQFRTAAVRNLDSWYAAFPIQAGEKLYLAPRDRVRIW